MTNRTEVENWARVNELLAQDWRMLIGGELVAAEGGRTFDVISPVTEKVIAAVPDATPAQVEISVSNASAAYPEWRDYDPLERARLVREMADTVEANTDDLALLDAVDGGAPIAVMASDVQWAAGFCRYMAGLTLEMKGYSVPSNHGTHFTVRQPFGVVAKIIPFNHPIMFAVSKLAAPLIAGNCVIMKPAETTPLSALHLARLIAGIFPPGVVQIVLGNGTDVPRALVRHPLIERIGFTGSEPTGRSILKDAAEVGIKEISLELGGKNALIAYPDAAPNEVASGAVRGMNFTWSGQSCGSTSRLLVHDSIADDVIGRIAVLLSEHTIGSPLNPAHNQGPMVTAAQYTKTLEFIADAVDNGAVKVSGGGRPAGVDRGFYIEPTVLDRVDPSWRIATEEVFGPVLSVIRWNDSQDPIAIANSVRYGLTGSVYTNDVRRAHQVAKSLETGYVWINTTAAHFPGMPFGGWKSSGLGREESLDELLSYTQVKSVNVVH